jgi:hypothetical protein
LGEIQIIEMIWTKRWSSRSRKEAFSAFMVSLRIICQSGFTEFSIALEPVFCSPEFPCARRFLEFHPNTATVLANREVPVREVADFCRTLVPIYQALEKLVLAPQRRSTLILEGPLENRLATFPGKVCHFPLPRDKDLPLKNQNIHKTEKTAAIHLLSQWASLPCGSFAGVLPRFAMLRVEHENAANFLDSLRVLICAMT